MYAVRLPSGTFLDLSDGANLQFDLQGTLFSGADAGSLPGSYSFPFEVKTTPKNRLELDQPALINAASKPKPIDGVWIYAFGMPFFYGTLTVREANPTSISVSITAALIQPIKDTSIRDLNLGGVRSLGANTSAALATAKDTSVNPLNYDFGFFPIYNPDYLTYSVGMEGAWQNRYDTDTQAYTPAADAPGFTPFIRLEYLLARILAGTDYTFLNEFQSTPELRRLYLYNNSSLYTNSALNRDFDLTGHVPDVPCPELLKAVCQTFCLAIITDPFKRTLRLVAMRDLINRPPAHDWTPYVSPLLTISHETKQAPTAFRYADQGDGALTYFARLGKPATVAGTYTQLANLIAANPAAGIYFITNEQTYYSYFSTTSYEVRYQDLGEYTETTNYPAPFESNLPTLPDEMRISYPAVPTTYLTRTPRAGAVGTIKYTYTPPGGSATVEDQAAECPLRLLAYRGMYSNSFTAALGDYPYANSMPYTPLGDTNIGAASLKWQGPQGLYATWWEGWHRILRDGKHCTVPAVLPFTALNAFSFDQKVKIASMDYFCKSIRVNRLLPGGRVEVNLSMVSVI